MPNDVAHGFSLPCIFNHRLSLFATQCISDECFWRCSSSVRILGDSTRINPQIQRCSRALCVGFAAVTHSRVDDVHHQGVKPVSCSGPTHRLFVRQALSSNYRGLS